MCSIIQKTVSINVSKLSIWGSTPFPGQPLTGAEGLFSIPLQGPSSPLFNFPSNYWNGLNHPLTCLDNVCKSLRASWNNFISHSDWDFCRLYFVLFIPTYHIQSIPIKYANTLCRSSFRNLYDIFIPALWIPATLLS